MNVQSWLRVARTISRTLALLALVVLGRRAGNKMNKPEGPALPGDEIKTLIIRNTVNGAFGAR